jgi:hypothetical protein
VGVVPALSTWTPEDGVLGAVAPLALAACVETALVVDLDPAGPRYPTESSLAQLVAEGPQASDLAPTRRGVAVLRNGGVEAAVAAGLVAALVEGWPAVVCRLPAWPAPLRGDGVVPVRTLLPGGLLGEVEGPAVYQRGPWRVPAPPDGIVVPRPLAATVGALLQGRLPVRGRWLRAWRPVWEAPWT